MLYSNAVKLFPAERPQLWHRLQPYDGDLKLQGNVDETLGVLEPSVFVSSEGVEMWYTDTHIPQQTVIRRAVAPDINSAFVKDPEIYIGYGEGGVPAGEAQNCGYNWMDGTTHWCIGTSGYGIVAGKSDGKVRIFSSASLASGFTNHGVIFDSSSFASVVNYGNVAVVLDTNGLPVQIGGKYRAIVECLRTGTPFWHCLAAESNSLTSGWTCTHVMSTMQPIAGAMYGGAWAMLIDGVIHIVYHYGSQVGDIPTLLAYGTSTDSLATVVKREWPFTLFNPYPYGTLTDQAADPWLVEINGNSYLFYEITDNSYTMSTMLRTQIRMKSFPGTLTQLFNGVRKT